MTETGSGHRERMTFRSLAAAGVLLVVCSPAAGASTGVHVTVSPAVGAPPSTFVVSYIAPTRTGVIGSVRLRDEVRAETATTSTSCQSSKVRLVADVSRGQHARVTMRAGAGWCAGTYKGRLVELRSPVCPPRALCPQS